MAKTAHLIQAERIFGAMSRAARQLGLKPDEARASALACVLRHTGVDLAAELGRPTALTPKDDSLQSRLADILCHLDTFEMEWLVTTHALGDAGSTSLYKRIGAVARRYGWRPHRICVDGKWHTVWKLRALIH